MAISSLPSIQMAHTAVMARRIKAGGGKPPEKDPNEQEPSIWERFKKWLKEN